MTTALLVYIVFLVLLVFSVHRAGRWYRSSDFETEHYRLLRRAKRRNQIRRWRNR